jgi:hypothetical protein
MTALLAGSTSIVVFCAALVCGKAATEVTIGFTDPAGAAKSQQITNLVNFGNESVPPWLDCVDGKCHTTQEELMKNGWYQIIVDP